MARRFPLARLLTPDLRRLGRIEALDLGLLLLVATTVFATWIAWFKWDSSLALAGHHAATVLMPFLPDLILASGDWRQLLYRPDILGGIDLTNITGILPITQGLAATGYSLTGSLNGTFLGLQILITYLCVRATFDLAFVWASEQGEIVTRKPHQLVLVAILTTIICGFSPVLMWRISHGQASLLAGLSIFVGALASVVAAARKRPSLLLMTSVLIGFCHGFQSSGLQLVLYSLLFGSPILVGLAWGLDPKQEPSIEKRLIRRLLPSMLCGLIALCIASPVLRLMSESVINSRMIQGRLGSKLIYASVTSEWRDWLQSLFWTLHFQLSSRTPNLLHETNYPLGPLLLTLALIPWHIKRWQLGRSLGVGVCLSLIWGISLAVRAEPLATWLLALIPPLGWFTIPMRAVLPFLMTLPVLGIAALMIRLPWSLRLRGMWPLLLVPLVWNATQGTRECLFWAMMLIMIILFYTKRTRWVALSTILSLLALGTLFASEERYVTPWPAEEIQTQSQHIGEIAQKLIPELNNPLNRIISSIEAPIIEYNSHYLMQLSSLDGSWIPNPRFLTLFHALNQHTHKLVTTEIKLQEESAGFPVLQALYNICANLTIEGTLLNARRVASCDRAAWFSRRLEKLSSIQNLADTLTYRIKNKIDIRATALLNENDPIWLSKRRWPEADCTSAKVSQVHAQPHQQKILLDVVADQACPLTVSSNFTEILAATRVDENGRLEPLDLFPVYGSLIGMVVPPGISRILIEPRRDDDPWTGMAQKLGFAMALILIPGLVFVLPSERPQRH